MNERFYLLKIQLLDIEPAIWRRFVVPALMILWLFLLAILPLYKGLIAKTAMTFKAADIKAIHQPVQLTTVYLQQLRPLCRPLEPVLLKALLPDTKTVTVPVEHLDYITPTVAEDKDLT